MIKISFFKNSFKFDCRGNIMIFAVIFGVIATSVVTIAISSYAIFENRASLSKHNREQAFQIAEAGIDYYRWHLAHDKADYYDGNSSSTPGPYVHEYQDKDGNPIGYFSLVITPPVSTSTIILIESTGWVNDQPNSRRTIKARLGFPAMTDYSFLTKTDVWIGDTEVTHGKFHANGGIRFDGTGDAPITSAVETYICKAHHGCGWVSKPGIWGTGGPTLYWEYPVPAVDFNIVTAKLANIKYTADSDEGLYLTSSGQQGYRLQFTADGQINVNKVLTTDCHDGYDVDASHKTLFCIDAKTFDTTTTYNMPTNGYIYVDDTVWVNGIVNGRATIGTAEDKDIIINDDIIYVAKDGNHVLGLISEQNILLPYHSPEDLEVDAAILAQNGAAKRYYYSGNTKDSLLIYGCVISNGTWTWSWVSGGGSIVSGYEYTNSTYDANLTYSPPPGFPVGSEYNIISWEEIKP
ncbi:MAG: hypothetical protein COU29_02515 [Candidatus Magasanikbacteria bacterium CG10_big_fil_rev_8_21_14_0_10_36_32]|uniref:Uncharacterized protein n=1 Tax=Candidatus Magasanikbacteria bacterium CG10_big_fil_rev_8_21_14_0_10_36_32 TaxID=1974646 RepID=A0A2M6W774_9BACT|nr:MAG: hypothetical protein COU29_02515 [Candidatus Magasanikbacteria bacterium CG10_big_fil_rev_8_21_14_0_10_36_32]